MTTGSVTELALGYLSPTELKNSIGISDKSQVRQNERTS